jgi:hypothetical protein
MDVDASVDAAAGEGDGTVAGLRVERPRQFPQGGTRLVLVDPHHRLDVTARAEQPSDHADRIGAGGRRPVHGLLDVEGVPRLPRIDRAPALTDLHGHLPRTGRRQVPLELRGGLRTAQPSDVRTPHRGPGLDLSAGEQQPGEIQTSHTDGQRTARQGDGRERHDAGDGGYPGAHGSPDRSG